MPEWLTKGDLQDFVNTLPDDAVLCPYCYSRMDLMEGDETYTYVCRNEMCLYEEEIPVETILNAQS